MTSEREAEAGKKATKPTEWGEHFKPRTPPGVGRGSQGPRNGARAVALG